MLNVIVVDDHPIFRTYFVETLTQAPDMTVVQVLDHSVQLFPALRKHPCDVVLLDLLMPGAFDPLAFLRELRQAYPALKILVVSGLEAGPYVQAVLALGIHGYLIKTDDLIDLPMVIRRMMQGERVLSDELEAWAGLGSPPNIGPQDLTLLRLLAQGYENDQIATALNLSAKTIRNLVTMLYRKLNLPDTPGLNKRVLAVNRARTLGLLDAP